jgi:anaerobic selenocysteine-containing dehydrogenase
LKYPLRRVGARGQGKWQRLSWPQALEEIKDRLTTIRSQDGARSVAFCQGMPKGLEHFVLIRLAHTFGSPNVVVVQDVCHGPREITGKHTCGFYPVPDYQNPGDLVLLWGSNPLSTNEEGQICKLLIDKLARGTELIVIDPRRTELAERAQIWLQIKPGTDHALALAMLHVIIDEGLYDQDFVQNWTYGFNELKEHIKKYSPEHMAEETWIPAKDIRLAARRYAKAQTAALGWGNPLEHRHHTFETLRSCVCLMAITGNLDRPGGNIQANEPALKRLGEFVRADLVPTKKQEMLHAHHETLSGMMTVPPTYFRRAVLENTPYPIKAAYIQCTNPLLTYADSQMTYETLMRLDFLAVSDIFLSPTACYADIVLPAATHFEFNDLGHYGLGHGCLVSRPKLVDPPEECWPDIKILNELGKILSHPKYWYDTPDALLDEVLAPSNLTYQEFVDKGILQGRPEFEKYTHKGFKTPTGKVELCLSRASQLGVSSLPSYHPSTPLDHISYPFILTSAKDPLFLHSSYRWVEQLRQKVPLPYVQIHPDTAHLYNITNDAEVLIETPHGHMLQYAQLTDRVHPQVLCAAYGWWFPEQGEHKAYAWTQSNYNMLTSTTSLGKEFGTPNLKGIACRIRPQTSEGNATTNQ